MKNFTQELKKIIKEDPGVPIMDPDELRARSQTIVILTNEAPKELLALAGPDRKATLLSIDPPLITLPYQKGVFKVSKDAIVFENHHSGRDVSEAGADETPYEKFFSQAMKKFGVSSPIELDPEDTKKFFNYVDKNWDAEEESDGSKSEDGWDDPPRLGGEPSLITPMEGDDSKEEILPAVGAGIGIAARAAGAAVGGAIGGALDSDDSIEAAQPKKKKKNKIDQEVADFAEKEKKVKSIKRAIKKGDIPKTYVDKKTGKRKKSNPWALASVIGKK